MKTYLIAGPHQDPTKSFARGLYMGVGLQGAPEVGVTVFEVSKSRLIYSLNDPFVVAVPPGPVEFEGSFTDMLIEFWRRATSDPGAAVFVEAVVQLAFEADRQQPVRDTLDSIRAHLGLASDEDDLFREMGEASALVSAN